jgi:hypothetical protein
LPRLAPLNRLGTTNKDQSGAEPRMVTVKAIEYPIQPERLPRTKKILQPISTKPQSFSGRARGWQATNRQRFQEMAKNASE